MDWDIPSTIFKGCVKLNSIEGIFANLNKISFSNNPLSMLLRMRQATGCPSILSQNASVNDSAKMIRMREIVDEITSAGGKVIIFSNWSSVTEEAKEMLKNYNKTEQNRLLCRRV